MTSYLSENEAKKLQNGDVYLAQIADFGMGYLKTIWRIEVSDGLFFALSCSFIELNFLGRSFPLTFSFNTHIVQPNRNWGLVDR